MGVNFVQVGDEVAVDLRNDTVTPETLSKGVTAHNANGDPIEGTRLDSVLLDDESNVEDITNAINAYKTYGANVLFTINGVDFSTLVSFKENPRAVLYFITTGQQIYRVAVENDNTVSYEYIEIVNRKDIIHTVLTEAHMDMIIDNANSADVGTCYMYLGETTENYTKGSVYRIGES